MGSNSRDGEAGDDNEAAEWGEGPKWGSASLTPDRADELADRFRPSWDPPEVESSDSDEDVWSVGPDEKEALAEAEERASVAPPVVPKEGMDRTMKVFLGLLAAVMLVGVGVMIFAPNKLEPLWKDEPPPPLYAPAAKVQAAPPAKNAKPATGEAEKAAPEPAPSPSTSGAPASGEATTSDAPAQAEPAAATEEKPAHRRRHRRSRHAHRAGRARGHMSAGATNGEPPAMSDAPAHGAAGARSDQAGAAAGPTSATPRAPETGAPVPTAPAAPAPPPAPAASTASPAPPASTASPAPPASTTSPAPPAPAAPAHHGTDDTAHSGSTPSGGAD